MWEMLFVDCSARPDGSMHRLIILAKRKSLNFLVSDKANTAGQLRRSCIHSYLGTSSADGSVRFQQTFELAYKRRNNLATL